MISVVIPTLGRPAQAVICIERLFETTQGHDVECVVVAEETDAETRQALNGLTTCNGESRITLVLSPPDYGAIAAWNLGAQHARGEWLVMGADDLVWISGWLYAALACESHGFCGLYDGHTDPKEHATHFLLSRAYIDEFQGGYLAPPYYRSWYADTEMTAIAKREGVYVCSTSARADHFHPHWGDAPDDATYQAGRKYYSADRRMFYRRKRFGFPNKVVPWGDNVRPIIGVPLERCIAYADEVFWAFISIAQQGWPFIKLPYTRIDVARNKFAMHLLDSDFTHLVMLDLDHEHQADVVKRLVQRVEEDPARLVVSGLNFRRGQPYEPIAFMCRDDATYSVADWSPGEMIPVDLIGCGCVIISREVFERLPGPPWFWNTYVGASQDNWPGEDITFSRLCRNSGIELWIDTATSSDHLIDGRVNEAVYRAYQQAHGGND